MNVMSNAEGGNIDHLERLTALREKVLLSPEEFDGEKERLFNNSGPSSRAGMGELGTEGQPRQTHAIDGDKQPPLESKSIAVANARRRSLPMIAVGAVLLLLGAAETSPVAAATPGETTSAPPGFEKYYSSALNKCIKNFGNDTISEPDLTQCERAETHRWDVQLNAAYRAKMATLSPDRQVSLRAKERDWLRLETMKCDHAGDNLAGGTGQDDEVASCYLDETIGRTLYVRSYQ
jgi:uncharacterized protein YecT (DUF1311 family)